MLLTVLNAVPIIIAAITQKFLFRSEFRRNRKPVYNIVGKSGFLHERSNDSRYSISSYCSGRTPEERLPFSVFSIAALMTKGNSAFWEVL